MTLEEKITSYKNELKKFDRYKFYEEPHIYTYVEDDGSETQMGISVTTFIGQYEQPFDENNVALKYAKKHNMNVNDVLWQWHYDRDFACVKGTHTHAYNEYLWRWSGEYLYSYDKEMVIAQFGEDVIAPVWDRLKNICEKFYQKFHDRLIPLGLEQIVASKDFDIAGAIDFLAYSKKLDSIIVLDYKTNKQIKFESYGDKTMKEPLIKIPDSNYYHYCLQLAVYKYLIQYETNLRLSDKKWLIWINEINDDFILYECENLDKEAEMILMERKEQVKKERQYV